MEQSGDSSFQACFRHKFHCNLILKFSQYWLIARMWFLERYKEQMKTYWKFQYNSVQMKQLEQQNEKLREALVRYWLLAGDFSMNNQALIV